MTEDEEKIMALMALAANFGRDFPESLLGIWLDLLKEYPARLVNAAVRKVIAGYEYKTLPPFAVLKKQLDELRGDSGQNLENLALAEWNKLQGDLASLGGWYGPPKNMNPATAAVLRMMGGWSAACGWKERELDWKRKDFLELWKQSYGKEDYLQLGADGIMELIAARRHGQKALPQNNRKALEASHV